MRNVIRAAVYRLALRVTQATVVVCLLVSPNSLLVGQDRPFGQIEPPVVFGPYDYEAKPEDAEFAKFNPKKAPAPGALILKPGDRLAIIGDSITEQKMYSRIIETYLTVCVPELDITARQYGWSGEKTDGFLRRMDRDCLTFKPTVATVCYGMNDARYRPFDVTNGRWYRDHYTAIIRKFKSSGARVVLGSPGCAGKLAEWVKSRAGTLDEHNLNLCALRDIGIEVAQQEQVPFADIFWPMYQAHVLGPKKYAGGDSGAYAVAGKDGIHPGWAGQVIMAYAFLKALGLDGDIGSIEVDLEAHAVKTSQGHELRGFVGDDVRLVSSKYPFCANGPIDRDDSIRSGMTLVPFNKELNRLTLRVRGMKADKYRVTWGESSREYSAAQLTEGVNLADDFLENPFSKAFKAVDDAVYAKQAYETEQVKKRFHSREADEGFAAIVEETEKVRQPLADAIRAARVPVEHTLSIVAL